MREDSVLMRHQIKFPLCVTAIRDRILVKYFSSFNRDEGKYHDGEQKDRL